MLWVAPMMVWYHIPAISVVVAGIAFWKYEKGKVI